jgi:hypothetical protein
MKVDWELKYFLHNEVGFFKNEEKNKFHSHNPRALKDSTGTPTTKLHLNLWLFELRHESEFQKL